MLIFLYLERGYFIEASYSYLIASGTGTFMFNVFSSKDNICSLSSSTISSNFYRASSRDVSMLAPGNFSKSGARNFKM